MPKNQVNRSQNHSPRLSLKTKLKRRLKRKSKAMVAILMKTISAPMKAALQACAMPVKRETNSPRWWLCCRGQKGQILRIWSPLRAGKSTRSAVHSHMRWQRNMVTKSCLKSRKTARVSTKLQDVHSDTKTIKKPDYLPSFHVLFS